MNLLVYLGAIPYFSFLIYKMGMMMHALQDFKIKWHSNI